MVAAWGASPCLAGWCGSGAGPLRHQFFLSGRLFAPIRHTHRNHHRSAFRFGAFEYSYRCWAPGPIAISFSPNVIPAAILLQPRETFLYGPAFESVVPAHAVYGFGVSPIGFMFEPARRRTLQPFFEMRGGIIASTERIPENVTDATALNFLFDFGGGVQWKIADKRAVDFGYRFLHISNAFTTPVNPGVDNNIFYVGLSFFR